MESPRVANLVQMLSELLGHEGARRVVLSTLTSCHVDPESVGDEEMSALLGRLSEAPGLVGVAAQLATARLRLESAQRRLRCRPVLP